MMWTQGCKRDTKEVLEIWEMLFFLSPLRLVNDMSENGSLSFNKPSTPLS